MRIAVNTIVCATDLSDFSNHSLPYGIAFAREFDARLLLCHVIDLPSITAYGDVPFDVVAQQNRYMDYARQTVERLMGEQHIAWEPVIAVGHPATQIARTAEKHEADMVIAASHGRSGLKRLLLGSVTERLMRIVKCPLLVVRSPEHEFVSPAGQHIQLKKIMVGCDFSPDSQQALHYALNLAQEFEAEIHLSHVIAPPLYRYVFEEETMFSAANQQDLEKKLLTKLTAMIPGDALNWCKPQPVLLTGQPFDELARYASTNDIDLVVLGIRGHTLLENLLVGSTTDRFIRQAVCPVLTVCAPTP